MILLRWSCFIIVLFLLLFLHSPLSICCPLLWYDLLFFLKFTYDSLKWCCFFIRIYKKLSFQHFKMVLFHLQSLWILLIHHVECWQYPLMTCDEFCVVCLLMHFVNILIHFTFNLPPSMSYLIGRFNPSRCRKINSFLNFKPFAFT